MNTSLTETATLRPLVLPARADAADAIDFLAYATVRNTSLFETTGRDDDHLEPAALLPLLRSNAERTRYQWIVVEDEQVIGIALLNVLADDDGRSAQFTINLLQRVWGRGIGSAVLAHVERFAADAGVQKLLLWTPHSDHGEPHLNSPVGIGNIPLDHPARFLQRHGFTLEQVVRASAFELSDENLLRTAALQAQAEIAADGYEIVQWHLPTPESFVDGYAQMKQRMSTDAPDAGLDMPEEIWDAERVARNDATHLDRGNTVLVTAAREIATGALCAYNELAIGSLATSVTHQEDTLVLSSHRGHRLGMLVKTSGLLSWHAEHPLSPRVVTFNAEENRPMLNINEEIGFAPISYEGAWRKDLV